MPLVQRVPGEYAVTRVQLAEFWSFEMQPQLIPSNVNNIIAIHNHAFEFLDNRALKTLVVFYHERTGFHGAFVHVVERHDVVILAPGHLLAALRYDGDLGLGGPGLPTALNFPPDELYMAFVRAGVFRRAQEQVVAVNGRPEEIVMGRDAKVPRPPNAFILYRKSMNDKVKLENPEMHNNERSKVIGASWAAEPQAVRDEWIQKAMEAKRQHALLYPHYKYQPRKPAEKKRRMTKKKAAALAADGNGADFVNGNDVDVQIHDADFPDEAGDSPVEQSVIKTATGSVSQHVSYTINGGPRMYWHGEDDFRPYAPGAENIRVVGDVRPMQAIWADMNNVFAGEWVDEALNMSSFL